MLSVPVRSNAGGGREENRDGIRLKGYALGGKYAAFQRYGVTAKDLPGIISLTWQSAEGDAMVFPVKIP